MILVSIYFVALCISYIHTFSLFDYHPLFINTLLSSNINTSRYLLSFFIACERLIAVFLPVKFHIYRRQIPTLIFVTFVTFYGISEDFIYFFICKVQPFRNPCSIFLCTWNPCFLNYWTVNKIVIASFSSAVSLVLFLKIMFLNKSFRKTHLGRTSYMCLVNGFVTLVSDVVPFLITKLYQKTVSNTDVLGPYSDSIKQISCFIDVLMATYMLIPRKRDNVTRVVKNLASGKDPSGGTKRNIENERNT